MVLRTTRQAIEVIGRSTGKVTPRALPADLAVILQANWAEQVELETAWRTNISKAKTTLSEERISLLPRPFRTQKVTFLSRTQQENTRLLAALARHTQTPNPIPLYPDHTLATDTGFGAVLPCDTRWRRIFFGQRIAIVDQNGDPQYATVLEVSPTYLVLDTEVTYITGDYIYPLIDADVTLEYSPTAHTDYFSQIEATFYEASGQSTLPASWTGDLRAVVQYYNGLPILDLPPNWAEEIDVGIIHDGTRFQHGKGFITNLDGARPRYSYDTHYLLETRENFWDMLTFFDGMKGRTGSFYMMHPQTLWRHASVQATYIDIEQDIPLADITDFFELVGVRNVSLNQLEIRTMDSVAVSGDYFRITLDAVLPADWDPAHRYEVTPAHLMRFDKDVFSESWHNNHVCTTKVTTRELLEEKAVAIT